MEAPKQQWNPQAATRGEQQQQHHGQRTMWAHFSQLAIAACTTIGHAVLRVRSATPEQQLASRLRRHGVRLYGADSCLKCSAQKAMLYHLSPTHWRELYVDCEKERNCLECWDVSQVPMWRISGQKGQIRNVGAKSYQQLQALVDEHWGDARTWKVGAVGSQRRHHRRSRWATESYSSAVERYVTQQRRDASVAANRAEALRQRHKS